MRGPPAWDLMKALAACSAAVIRFGFTSVEHMEPETSRASMIVADDDATGTVACGRAAPTASTARPSVSSAAGMRRRQRERPGRAVRTSAIEVTRTAARLRLRRVQPPGREHQRDDEEREQRPRPGEATFRPPGPTGRR